MGKSSIKTCRYAKCAHDTKTIDISSEEFEVDGQKYYHKDCYEAAEKEAQIKRDLQYIKNQWVLHINKAVVYSQLFKVLNGFINNGVSSSYLVFCVDYIISHGMKINYPFGLKYYVGKPEIKAAYMKSKIAKMKRSEHPFDIDYEDPPKDVKPQIKRSSPKGFESILRRDKQEN